METYEERMTLPYEPGEALAACAQALGANGFDNVETNARAGMITATRTNAKLRESRVVVVVKAAPSGSSITVRGAARRIASVFSSPARHAVRAAIGAMGMDARGDRERAATDVRSLSDAELARASASEAPGAEAARAEFARRQRGR
jgi:hypothetical protein